MKHLPGDAGLNPTCNPKHSQTALPFHSLQMLAKNPPEEGNAFLVILLETRLVRLEQIVVVLEAIGDLLEHDLFQGLFLYSQLLLAGGNGRRTHLLNLMDRARFSFEVHSRGPRDVGT